MPNEPGSSKSLAGRSARVQSCCTTGVPFRNAWNFTSSIWPRALRSVTTPTTISVRPVQPTDRTQSRAAYLMGGTRVQWSYLWFFDWDQILSREGEAFELHRWLGQGSRTALFSTMKSHAH